jgi:protein-L-isoaspartate(D-aspartate) O-methyltransferase
MALARGLAEFVVALALLGAVAFAAPEAQYEDLEAGARRDMVEEVARGFQATRARGLPSKLSTAVADAMRAVPRHEFVPSSERDYAYENRPLPIGYGQTISQPQVVALMTELAGIAKGARVLEIGTGSGYQAAVAAQMGARVYTIEIVPELGAAAAARLKRLGYGDVEVRVGDGYFGWPEAAPFDAILVTAAASHVPPPLLEQLAQGGRMVIPVGPPFLVQQLVLVTKDKDGAVRTRQLLPVSFVPLTRAS